ncbi:hypothetical protein L1987_02169 [Smallanthus sonchifolius]|uniref:Uncharacterized protein n=1 Tax=Smallanthus sonchifolius TaxID=185202 RepID=A0ACB9K759_9ASTR|nr:hypothetical protein L1987_02169 [Smallanthus sonchifolius]
MPRKKEQPPSALPSRRSTRANNRFSDSEPLVVPMVGLGSNQEVDVRISQPPSMEIPLDMNKYARPILSDARSGMPPIQDVSIEKDACRMNKEQTTVSGCNTSSECSSASVRDMDSMADKVGLSTPISSAGKTVSTGLVRKTVSTGLVGKLDTTGNTGSVGSIGLVATRPTDNFPMPTPLKCGVFGHNDDVHNHPHPLPVVETSIRDPPTVAPAVATKKGKNIMEDGFIKVVKKKKKFNGPKPRVQIPSLNVSKPGPSKPPGRTRPNVDNGAVHVSNPFSALDDTTQTKDGFPELNTTLKKFAKRYVETNTIPDSDVSKTWSNDLKVYYYSLTKEDVEEVESETDGTTKLMSTGVP